MSLFYFVDITIGLRVNEIEEKEGADIVYHILPDNLIEQISIEPQPYDKEEENEGDSSVPEAEIIDNDNDK